MENKLNRIDIVSAIKSEAAKGGNTKERIGNAFNLDFIDNLQIIPNWLKAEFRTNNVATFYDNDTDRVKNRPYKMVEAITKKLYFTIPDFDLIADFTPEVIMERYTRTKGSGSRNNQTAGFKKSGSFNVVGISTEVFLSTMNYFRLYPNDSGNHQIQAKSFRRLGSDASVILQFRLRLKINNQFFTTKPLLKMKLNAKFHANPTFVKGYYNLPRPIPNVTLNGIVVMGYTVL